MLYRVEFLTDQGAKFFVFDLESVHFSVKKCRRNSDFTEFMLRNTEFRKNSVPTEYGNQYVRNFAEFRIPYYGILSIRNSVRFTEFRKIYRIS